VNVNYIITENSSRISDFESSSKVIDGSVSLNYFFSRRFSVNMRYNFTDSSDSLGLRDYTRNRIFFTGRYDF
jgi:hypothetical protein